MSTPITHQQKSIAQFNIKLIGFGFVVGCFSGLLSVAYRFAISQTEILRRNFYQSAHLSNIFIAILAIISFTYIIVKLLAWAPFSNGSGIPQIKAEILDRIDPKPIPTVISKFIGGILNNLMGYSVGREGPSIQIGGMIAKWLAQTKKFDAIETKYLTTAGASAGLSAAFNAPMAGVLFSVEEMYGSLSHAIMIPCIIASVMANYISFKLLGFEPAFSFSIHENLSIQYLPGVLLLGVLCGFIGVLFNVGLIKTGALFQKINLRPYTLILIISFLMFIVGFFQADLQGGGHHLIEQLIHNNYALPLLIMLLIGKLCLTLICYNSGVQGGIFLPVLVIGAIVGVIYYQMNFPWIAQGYLNNYIILGMVGVLCAVIQAPLLSIILVIEMTGSFDHLISVTTVAMVALLTVNLLKIQPIYESLYHNLLNKINGKNIFNQQELILTDLKLPSNHPVNGLTLRQIEKPCYFVVAEIIRDGQHILPNADDQLKGLDQMTLLHYREDTEQIKQYFNN